MAEGIPADAFDAEAVTNAQALALSIQPHSQPQSHPKSNSLPSPIPTPIPITTAIPIPAPAPQHHGIRGTQALALFTAPRRGLFALLNEECIFPKGSDATFTIKLFKEHSGEETAPSCQATIMRGPSALLPFFLCFLAHTLHASFRLHTPTTLNADVVAAENPKLARPPGAANLPTDGGFCVVHYAGKVGCHLPLGASTPCRCLHPLPSPRFPREGGLLVPRLPPQEQGPAQRGPPGAPPPL